MARTWLRGLSIAGIQLGIEVPDTVAWQWPKGPIAGFACLPRAPEVHVGVRVGDPDAAGELGGERYSVGSAVFEVARRGNDWLLAVSRSGRRELLALFDAGFRVGEIVMSTASAASGRFPLASPLDEWIVLNRAVARGGLCLIGAVRGHDARSTRVELGPAPASGPATALGTSGLFGRYTVLLREDEAGLRVFRTPWTRSWPAGFVDGVGVQEIALAEPSPLPFREVLDPAEAADGIVAHAVVPFCDHDLVEGVLRNARRVASRVRTVRVGRPVDGALSTDAGHAPLPHGFAPPRAVI
ncbi:MAG: hypothetical protein KC616_14770 [Myxococcales bacterium]|nr:hypothetical protein [Myxococcales bacterium]